VGFTFTCLSVLWCIVFEADLIFLCVFVGLGSQGVILYHVISHVFLTLIQSCFSVCWGLRSFALRVQESSVRGVSAGAAVNESTDRGSH
jgi:hypothetical protein